MRIEMMSSSEGLNETRFDPGINIRPETSPLRFVYGSGIFGPEVELRALDSIRLSLLNPECSGPDPVYAIAMDVGKVEHRTNLIERNLLYGVVTYAAGRLGREPVRSQGHVHKKARGNNLPPPEIYEIWRGRAIVYMQEHSCDDPGKCYAIEATPGEVVIVPPGWVHASISADQNEPLTFGAWCERDYGFEYGGVRAHGGLAWYPILDDDGKVSWRQNERYMRRELIRKRPASYRHLGIKDGVPIYTAFEKNPDVFLYVSNPQLEQEAWEAFEP